MFHLAWVFGYLRNCFLRISRNVALVTLVTPGIWDWGCRRDLRIISDPEKVFPIKCFQGLCTLALIRDMNVTQSSSSWRGFPLTRSCQEETLSLSPEDFFISSHFIRDPSCPSGANHSGKWPSTSVSAVNSLVFAGCSFVFIGAGEVF